MTEEKLQELENTIGFVLRDIDNLKDTSFDLDCILETLAGVLLEVVQELKQKESK